MRSQILMLCKPRGRTCARRSDWPEPRVDAPHLPSKRRHASLLIHPPPGVMLAILILLLAVLCGIVAATPSLSLSISVPQSVGVDELSVVATITNTGKYPLKLLNHPQTILSHFPTRIFDIRRGNDTPEFIGAIVHYSPEYVVSRNNSVDFTFLSPGDTSERVHTLAGVYNFTGIGPGEFQIVAYNRFYHVDASRNIIPLNAETQPITFNLTSSLSRKKTIPFTRLGLSNKCTPEQQTTLTAATTSATSLISSALSYLSTLTTDSPRYTTWFGLYDPARIQTVKSNYANSLSAIQSMYDCAPDACQDGSVAYVWRQQPGVVHLCGWFWLRPGYGSDSQAGTIIHELSHFAGTEDYVYGQLGARDLAVTSPGVAVVNADNYMYFAENYPPLQ